MAESNKGGKKKAAAKEKKEPKPKKPRHYSVVINPVRPTIEEVDGEEELFELLRQHADMLGIPESEIESCGLFTIFKGKEVKIKCQGIEIKLSS